MFSESKICFVLVLLLMCPIIFKIDYILDLWLGVVPPQTNIFAILVLTDALICTLNTPCSQVVFATGNLKYYQIASSAINLCLLPVCLVMLLSGFNAASVFITTIVFSILNQTVCVWQAHKVFAFSRLYKKDYSSLFVNNGTIAIHIISDSAYASRQLCKSAYNNIRRCHNWNGCRIFFGF